MPPNCPIASFLEWRLGVRERSYNPEENARLLLEAVTP